MSQASLCLKNQCYQVEVKRRTKCDAVSHDIILHHTGDYIRWLNNKQLLWDFHFLQWSFFYSATKLYNWIWSSLISSPKAIKNLYNSYLLEVRLNGCPTLSDWYLIISNWKKIISILPLMKRRRLQQILNVFSDFILNEISLGWKNLPSFSKIMISIIQEQNCYNS